MKLVVVVVSCILMIDENVTFLYTILYDLNLGLVLGKTKNFDS